MNNDITWEEEMSLAEQEMERSGRVWPGGLDLIEEGLGIAADVMAILHTTGGVSVRRIALKMVAIGYKSVYPVYDGNIWENIEGDSEFALAIEHFLEKLEERHPKFWDDCNENHNSPEGLVLPYGRPFGGRILQSLGYESKPSTNA